MRSCPFGEVVLPGSLVLLCVLLNGSRLQGRLPWWSSGCKSACQCRGHRFYAWTGRILHAEGDKARTPQLVSLHSRACALQQESSPCSTQLDKACEQQQRPGAAKINDFLKSATKCGLWWVLNIYLLIEQI